MQDNQSHWVNNFWGANDAGYHQLMQRMQNSRQTCDEIKQYYRERMSIEQEYSRKLMHLSRRPLGSSETGEMKTSLEIVRSTTKNAASTHETVARQLNEQLLAPLHAFASSVKGRSKTIEDTMNELTRAKTSQNNSCEKARNKYVAECNRISGYQASQNLLMGKELDRNNQKLDKASYQVEGLQRQYQDSLKALAQSMETWNSEWRVSCEKLEQLEEERLSFLKSSLWAFTNAISAACVADDEACESVRLALERCDPMQDLEGFSKAHGTGSRIQDPPEFVNFLQGFSREADDGDGHYHVANFGSSLNNSTIPDLGVPSPASSRQLSPMSNQSQFSPASSPGASTSGSPEMRSTYQMEKQYNQSYMMQQSQQPQPQLQPPQLQPPRGSLGVDKEQIVKKRRSWAMPFRRKQTAETFNVSALDEPLHQTSESLKPPSAQVQFPSEPDIMESRRKSWAPSAQPPAAKTYSSSGNEDPLLTALERLKTPGFKARPKSGGALAPGGYTSPYGNGSPLKLETPHQGPSQVHDIHNGRKSPVRKQVGSSSTFPQHTTDGRKVIKHSRAQFDYRAAIPEEVTFRKGDLLLITEMQEDGWWDCEVANAGGVFGLAPSNFLADA